MRSRFLCKQCRPWRHAAHALERFAEAWAAVPWPIKIKTEMYTAIILGRQIPSKHVQTILAKSRKRSETTVNILLLVVLGPYAFSFCNPDLKSVDEKASANPDHVF